MKSHAGYIFALVCSVSVILYSVYFFSGYKEQYIVHFVVAAFMFPIIGNSFQQHSMVKDFILSLIVTISIIGVGSTFWIYQDTKSDFSFENDFMWYQVLIGFAVAFVLSQIIKKVFRRFVRST